MTVQITLPQAVRQQLDNTYENGAYVEGYVYLTPAVSEDGVLAPVHSIPVLGFYGDWSDPSMFDRGTYPEYQYGLTEPKLYRRERHQCVDCQVRRRLRNLL